MSLPSAKKLLMAAGGARDPDAKALIARMTVRPSITRQRLIDKTIVALKSAGIWSRLDCLYMLAAHSEQASFLNWRQNRFNCVKIGQQSFAPNTGFQAQGQTGYLRTGLVPKRDTDTMFATQLNHIAAHIHAPAAATGWSLGTFPQGSNGGTFALTAIRPRLSDGSATVHLDINSSQSIAGSYPELMVRAVKSANRQSFQTLVNKSGSVRSNNPSVAPDVRAMFNIGNLGADETGNPSSNLPGDSRLIRFVAIGGNGEALEAPAYFDIIQTYLREVGAIA